LGAPTCGFPDDEVINLSDPKEPQMSMVITPASQTSPATSPLEIVTLDLYRDIHKAIRSELFAVTLQAGNVDPSSRPGRVEVASRVDSVVDLLLFHAEHEDTYVQPSVERHLADLADQIEGDHVRLEAWMDSLRNMANEAVAAQGAAQRAEAHRLYIELAAFTSSYLAHQDLEERVVMPALDAALGFEAVLGIHVSIVSNIPPEQMAQSLAIMIPAMNIDDRTELLGGMRAGAPPEVFEGIWGLTGSVLPASEFAALGARLGLAA
jgi:iron-sulfur cluster repair protein YtfE (RIC family)